MGTLNDRHKGNSTGIKRSPMRQSFKLTGSTPNSADWYSVDLRMATLTAGLWLLGGEASLRAGQDSGAGPEEKSRGVEDSWPQWTATLSR